MRSNLGGRRHDEYYANRRASVSLAKELSSPRPPRLAAACPRRPGDLDSARSAFPAEGHAREPPNAHIHFPPKPPGAAARTRRTTTRVLLSAHLYSSPSQKIIKRNTLQSGACPRTLVRQFLGHPEQSCARRAGGAILRVRTSAEEADVRAFRNGRPADRTVEAGDSRRL